MTTTPLAASVTPNKRMDERRTHPFRPPPTHASLTIENRRASVHAGFGRRDAENYLVDRFRSKRQRGGGDGKGRRYTARTAYSPQASGAGSPILAARPRKCCHPISRLALWHQHNFHFQNRVGETSPERGICNKEVRSDPIQSYKESVEGSY